MTTQAQLRRSPQGPSSCLPREPDSTGKSGQALDANFQVYVERNLLIVTPTMPPTVPSTNPGRTIIRGNSKASLSPPPSRSIKVSHAVAIRSIPHPVLDGFPENPYPGSDGHTTSNPRWVSGSMTLWNSTIDPGQPCVITNGKASARGERWWMKWMSSPSISVVNWSNRLSACSRARQS